MLRYRYATQSVVIRMVVSLLAAVFGVIWVLVSRHTARMANGIGCFCRKPRATTHSCRQAKQTSGDQEQLSVARLPPLS